MLHRWCLLLFSVISIFVWADELFTQPWLRVEADAHTAAINQLALTNDGSLISVADDKTARLWNLSLQPLATIRVPIGSGMEGALYTVAASPNKAAAVVAGATAVSWDGGPALYALDLKTNQIKGRLGGLPGTVTTLAYSSDGRYLAIGTGAFPALRVYDLDNRAVVASDPSYGDSLNAALFLPDGRLVTSALDGKIRLYANDFRLIATQKLPYQARPKQIAYSPNGERLAVGTLERNVVHIFSVKNLRPLRELTPLSNKKAGNFSAVAWAGEWVFGAGTYSDANGFYLHAWHVDGNSTPWELKIANDTVTNLLNIPDSLSPDKRLAFATADAVLGLVNINNKTTQTIARPISDFRDAYQGVFAVNQDASIIDFGTVKGGKAPLRFDLPRRRLSAAVMRPDLIAPRIPEKVKSWRNNQHPLINGKPLALDKNEFARAVAEHNDLIVLGADYSLRLLRGGLVVWKISVASTVWAVNVSGDGRYVLAALGDGTLRWYRSNDGSETLALFVTNDQRWILWSPEGYFDHSANAENLIGYHINTTQTTAPKFVAASQLYRDFFRPELITSKWAGKDINLAMQYTGQAAEVAARQIPAAIKLLDFCVANNCQNFDNANRTTSLTVNQRDITLRVALNDRGSGIGNLILKRNGGNVYDTRGFARTAPPPVIPPELCSEQTRSFARNSNNNPQLVNNQQQVNANQANCLVVCSEQTRGFARETNNNPQQIKNNQANCLVERNIALEPGDNQIELIASDGSNSVDGNPTTVKIRYELPKINQAQAQTNIHDLQPDLYLLSIGINQYNDKSIPPLKNAEADAQGIVDELLSKGIYHEIQVIGKIGANRIPERKALLGSDATLNNIQTTFDYIAERARPEDSLVLFIAGHGIVTENDKKHPIYNSITYDTSVTQTGKPAPGDIILQKALDQKTLATLINQIKASRILVILDTCQSGQALENGDGRSIISLSNETGRGLMAAAANTQYALDGGIGPDQKKHGVFTGVVMSGLHGKAEYNQDGFIDIRELAMYVEDHMQEAVKTESSSHRQDPIIQLGGVKVREFKLKKN